ncbi:nucleoside-diphosphate sugar epimerase [Haemophilus paracuniculus]|uniref:Nucleoside-diphosphate sugar epimerase n=1 Tax=Haemophilus paracuniculus TaxID=734 RepID=A0A1T0ATG5_9PAST|nr:nucleoside-diphosphate sugar epimerase/dehydratase [Haemophilus paracuniculus]OOR99851.1 nucleoside-diphosphate sugar epimerase [Haemophilus paracuniculus]
MIDYIIFNLSRTIKKMISLFVDTLLIVFSFLLAYWTRLGNINTFETNEVLIVLSGTVIVTILVFAKLGLYQAILRYISFRTLALIGLGSIVSAICVTLLSLLTDSFIPKTVPIIYCAYVFMLCSSIRILARYYIGLILDKDSESILIYGAGSNGRQLAVMLRHAYRYRIHGFIDDNKKLQGTHILGKRVYSLDDVEKLVGAYQIKTILLAIPSASRAERKAIIKHLSSLKLKIQTIPDMEEILQGTAKIDELREVKIENLLGRDPVQPNKDLLQKNVFDQVVMVTGAGGSIGSELCRQIVRNSPKKLILFELSEFSLYSIQMELQEIIKREKLDAIEIIPILGNVQNIERLDKVLSTFPIDTIYHAAAYKHVPLVEYNIIEGVRNNIFGTYYTAKLAAKYNVKSFVLISTDKAVRPTNVMGATKRMAELCLQALAQQMSKETDTCFSMVRFGNVLGSSGSVIPLFRKQIQKGGPITVTHPDIIRYFMTIPEAAQLVIQAGAMAKGGDVFILDMGEPVRIVELAKNLIELSGLKLKTEDNPTGDIEITYTGLRPGEKLYEELLIAGDNVQQTQHDRIMTSEEVSLSFDELLAVLEQLDNACEASEYSKIRQILLDAPTGFNPTTDIVDVVHCSGIRY